jgi:predicted dehydrogenase
MSAPDRREFLLSSAGALAASVIAPDAAALHPAPLRGAPLSIALVGAGRQGRAILGELATIEGVEIRAVCDTDASRLDAATKRAQGARAYASHTELLANESGVSAVVIATPTHRHKEIALDCVAAKKHVYCEAPLAHTVEDCKAIQAAARGASTVFAAGFQGRANPVYQLARSFFKAGTLRELALLRAQSHKKTSWRTPGSTPERDRELNWHLEPAVSLGLEGEQGAHQFDVVQWFLGRYPVAAAGRGAIRLFADGRAMPDTVHASLRFEDGLLFDWTGTLANSFEGRYELFTGAHAAIKLAWTHGWMFKESDAPTQGWEVYANRQQFHNDQGITLIADATKLAAQGKLQEGVGLPYTPLYYSLADFARAASEGKAPACTVDDAARSTMVAILVHAAVAKGAEVAIDPGLLQD